IDRCHATNDKSPFRIIKIRLHLGRIKSKRNDAMSKSTQKLSPLQELIAEQKLLCEEVGSTYIEVSGDDVIAVAVHTLNQDPIVGIRKTPDPSTRVSWYIYAGEEVSSDADFEILTVRELQDIAPEVLPYLALEQGFRFMIDADDYEDVWKEGQE